mgnify:CR=1 FL=1
MSEAKEYLFGAALGAGGVATLWIGVEAGTLFGAAALTGLFAFGAVCRYRMLSEPPAAREAIMPGHILGGYKDGDERFIRDCEHPTEPPKCQVYYGGKWWTAWSGGPCPVLDCVRVDVRFRDGREVKNRDPGGWNWDHVPSPHRSNRDGDIIAYRLSDATA